MAAAIKHVRTADARHRLRGNAGDGAPVILLHGFPYDAARL